MDKVVLEEIVSDFPYELLLLADESTEAIERYLSSCQVFLVKNNLGSIGVVAIERIDEDTVEIKNMAIRELMQGKGYGRLAIAAVKQHFKGMNFKTLLVGTGDASIGNIRFYEKCGFKKFCVRRSFFEENYPSPIYENGIQLRDMVVLKLELNL